MNAKQKLQKALDRAKELQAAAGARDLTAGELAEVKSLSEEIPQLREEITTDENVADGKALLKQLGESGKQIYHRGDAYSNLSGPGADPTGYVQQGAKATGFMRLKSDAPATAARLAGDTARVNSVTGSKALLTEGASVTGVSIDQSVIALGRPAGSILDVLPVAVQMSPAYRFLRQTVRTNNAAVVDRGATKPTSIYTLESVDASLQVVAHLSEAVDTYMLTDMAGGLAAFIANELSYGLNLAVEELVLTTVAADAGISTQSYTTDLIHTSRSAVTKLQVAGVEPSFWFVHPNDWQAFELQQDAQERFYRTGVDAPVELASRRLWSAPVVVSTAATEGSGYLFGQGAARLATDGQVMLRWSEMNDDFEKNQVRARLESRFNPDVLRPWAIVNIDLTSGS